MKLTFLAAFLVCQSASYCRQSAASAILQSVENDGAKPKSEDANYPVRSSFWDFLTPYRRPTAPPLHLGSADRAPSLVRNGAIYLSLYDALALAIENNLDVEVARYQQGSLDPFSSPNTSATVTQPLLRGCGRDINLRYIRIAAMNQKISRLIFYQQLISTVYGVARRPGREPGATV